VEFALNPNMHEFRRKYKEGSQKPILFIYSPPMYMGRQVAEFKEALKPYADTFDIYYCSDQWEASKYFYTKEFPDVFPFVVVIDTKKRKALASGQQGPFEKYRKLIFYNKIQKHLTELIEEFLEGEAEHFFQSERMR